MGGELCIIQGHTAGDGKRLCHALADCYAAGARSAGATVTAIDIGAIEIDFLRTAEAFTKPPPPPILAAQEKVVLAAHLLVIYPLWLGSMPAIVKAFFEQLSRSEFAVGQNAKGWPRQMLKGRSARVAVTMGMPAAAYRLCFGADGVKSFGSGVLRMAGFSPIKETLVGGVGALSSARAEAQLRRFEKLGAQDALGHPRRRSR